MYAHTHSLHGFLLPLPHTHTHTHQFARLGISSFAGLGLNAGACRACKSSMTRRSTRSPSLSTCSASSPSEPTLCCPSTARRSSRKRRARPRSWMPLLLPCTTLSPQPPPSLRPWPTHWSSGTLASSVYEKMFTAYRTTPHHTTHKCQIWLFFLFCFGGSCLHHLHLLSEQ